MGVEIQAAPDFNLTGEIQRLYHDTLAADGCGLHIRETHKGQAEFLAGGCLPGKFVCEGPVAEIRAAG